MEKMRADSWRPKRSRTTALEITTPEHAPSACRKRKAIIVGMSRATAQPRLAAR